MNRSTFYLMMPFFVFLAVIAVWGGTTLLLVSAAVIARVLQNFMAWTATALPQMLFTTFTDPWKIASLPIAVGVVIIVGFWAWKDLTDDSCPEVLRGRELGSSRQRERSRRTSSREVKQGRNQPRGGRTPWTRSSPPPRR